VPSSGRSLLPRSKGKRLLLVLGVLCLLIAAGAIAAAIYKKDRTGSIYHRGARFTPQANPTLPAATPTQPFSWPIYGYTTDHTRYFPASSKVRPPFRQMWVLNRGALLEFPPVIYGEHLFQLADNGNLASIDKRSGHTVWQKHIGKLSASTPAVTADAVYATVLNSGHPSKPGRVVAVSSKTGDILWSRYLPSPSESSPLLDEGRIFFGSQAGTVYALSAHDGHVIWSYHAAGSVKASPTLSDGKLYFGDYSGHLQAISEKTGKLVWRSGSAGALIGSGTFYSTSAVFYGRVFLGNTDGRIYAYDAETGKLDWAVQTGAYVYSSPAVTNAPGLGPTVYIGSYDGTFYALNARTGAIEWRFNAHGRISGSPTIVGNIVYFSDLGQHNTFGLGISTGRLVFEKQTGAFDPVVSDGRDIYLNGYTGLFGLEPLDVEPEEHEPSGSKARAKEKRAPTSTGPGLPVLTQVQPPPAGPTQP
jgi:outer membrane protein assembly factor BamB